MRKNISRSLSLYFQVRLNLSCLYLYFTSFLSSTTCFISRRRSVSSSTILHCILLGHCRNDNLRTYGQIVFYWHILQMYVTSITASLSICLLPDMWIQTFIFRLFGYALSTLYTLIMPWRETEIRQSKYNQSKQSWLVGYSQSITQNDVVKKTGEGREEEVLLNSGSGFQ